MAELRSRQCVAAKRRRDKLVKCKTILLNSLLKVLVAARFRKMNEVTIELEGGGSLLWVTLPSSLLPQMQMIVRELDALAIDARNGVAREWHLPCTGSGVTASAPPVECTVSPQSGRSEIRRFQASREGGSRVSRHSCGRDF
jgi:hypothetical protein